MLKVWLMSIPQLVLTMTLFFLPVYFIVEKRDYKLFIYSEATAIFCYFVYQLLYSFNSAIQVEMMGIYSIIAFGSLNAWYLSRELKMKSWLETVLLTHLEGIFCLQFMPMVDLSGSYEIDAFLRVLFILFFLLILAPINRKVLSFSQNKQRRFFIWMVLLVAMFYLYWRELGIYFAPSEHVQLDMVGEQSTVPFVDEIKSALLFSLIFCAGAGLTILVIMKERMATKRLKEKTVRESQLKNYIETIESMQMDIRKIHHDYNNLILALGGYLYEDSIDVEGMREFYSKISGIQAENTLKTVHLTKIKKIEHLELKGLLTTKLVKASQLGIKVAVEIDDRVRSLPIETVDLLRIIGNFLDNAIEACVDQEDSKLRVAFISLDTYSLLIIENTAVTTSLSIEDIKQEGVSSKGENRGLGFSNILELLSCYPEVELQTTLENQMFRQTLIY